MKKFLAFVLTFMMLLNTTVFAVTDGADEVTLVKPVDDETVSGTYKIEWIMKDDEIDSPAFFIDVFNLSCSQNGGNIGRVTSSGEQKDGDNYSFEWDTSKGATGSALRDGSNYCMRVCGIMARGSGVYSLCDKNSFVFSKTQSGDNNNPEITDTKTTIDAGLNEDFTHKVTATDEDNDTLTFSLVGDFGFMKINSSTGEITGKASEVGNIKFVVKVDDGKGGIDTKEYILNVGNEQSVEFVNITSPTAETVFSPEESEIVWTVNEDIKIKSVVISYSNDQSNWTEITRMDRNTGSYEWDIANLEAGDYYIQIQVADQDNQLFESVSDQFQVNPIATDTTQIINLFPTEGSQVQSSGELQISAEFITPEGVTIDIDKVVFTLDGREDLTVCDISQSGIDCDLAGELTSGSHTASVTVVDSTGATQIKEWSFNITAESGESENALTANTLQLILIIFAIGFVLIALPWTLYIFYKRRKNQKSTKSKKPTDGDGIPADINLPGETLLTQSDQQIQPVATQSVITDPITTGEGSSMETVTPVGSQTVENVIPQPSNIEQPPCYTPTPTQNIDTAQLAQTPVVESSPVAEQTVAPLETLQPDQTINSSATSINNLATSPSGDLQSVPETEAPGMYRQEEIPDWMKTSEADTTSQAETDTKTVSNAKSEVAEGSRVYDPYGLALNPDESNENQ